MARSKDCWCSEGLCNDWCSEAGWCGESAGGNKGGWCSICWGYCSCDWSCHHLDWSCLDHWSLLNNCGCWHLFDDLLHNRPNHFPHLLLHHDARHLPDNFLDL